MFSEIRFPVGYFSKYAQTQSDADVEQDVPELIPGRAIIPSPVDRRSVLPRAFVIEKRKLPQSTTETSGYLLSFYDDVKCLSISIDATSIYTQRNPVSGINYRPARITYNDSIGSLIQRYAKYLPYITSKSYALYIVVADKKVVGAVSVVGDSVYATDMWNYSE